MSPLEKQLQSWTPRRPSPKIARKLFGGVAPAPVFLRRGDVWHWFAPVAACALTVVVTVFSANHRLTPFHGPDNASYFATLMANANSNLPRTVVLSRRDENLEWNVWPHAVASQTIQWVGSAGINVLERIPTNH